MPFYSALEAIVLGTFVTLELFASPFSIQDECKVAVSCGTPGEVFLDIQIRFK
jgi:hypothetical protein